MNKNLFMSIAMLVFAGVAIAGATGAFFSDTETSTGNTFTAGAIDLKVDSVQHYNGMVCAHNGTDFEWAPNGHVSYTPGDDDYPSVAYVSPMDANTWNTQNPLNHPAAGDACSGTWAADELEDGQGATLHKFFEFNDIKPGDEGENTLSLHVYNNEAWACVDIDITKNDDMDCTEPENADTPDGENGSCDVNNDVTDGTDGDLAANMYFMTWIDEDGDNVWDGTDENEPLLFSNDAGPASDIIDGVVYPIADITTPYGPLSGNETVYIGLAWCAGEITVTNEATGAYTCDGETMGNDTQTDMMEVDFSFYVEQARNNDTFTCEDEII